MKKEIGIFDLLLALAKGKKFVIIFTGIISVLVVIYALVATQYWSATATIRPVTESSTAPSAAMQLFGVALGGAKTESSDFVTLLMSRTFSEKVIEKFNLVEYFEIDVPDKAYEQQLATTMLAEGIRNIVLNDENGLISISALTKDSQMSADIANYYCELLDEYNKNYTMTKGRQNREFIGKRIEQIEQEVVDLKNRINDFQTKNKTIALNIQTENIIETYSELIAETIKLDIEIEYSKKFYDENAPQLLNAIEKKLIILAKLTELEKGNGELKPKYMLAIDDIPNISQQYGQLKLNLETKLKLYEFLFPQYESAKIEELKDLPTVEIVDKAIPMGLRAKPARGKMCVLAFMAAFIFSSLLTIIWQLMGNEQKSVLAEIWCELKKHK